MGERTVSPRLTALALAAGIAVPFLYFGAQLAAAPFFPGYSFLRQSASMLGSDLSTLPVILNAGAILTGLAAILASVGFLQALRNRGTQPRHRLADVRRSGLVRPRKRLGGLLPPAGPEAQSGIARSGVLPAPGPPGRGVLERTDPRSLRLYLIVNVLVMAALVPVMSGIAGIDRASYGGLLQRIAALTLFPPIGVVAWFLRRDLLGAYEERMLRIA